MESLQAITKNFIICGFSLTSTPFQDIGTVIRV